MKIVRNEYCCLCGSKRNKLSQPQPVSNCNKSTLVSMEKTNRPMLPNRWEEKPQMIVSFNIYRNGGTSEDTHICGACLKVGLKTLKAMIKTITN